nr:MAG TPA: Type I restriction enzyme Methylase [Caudoviricetes sp.]
MGYFDEFQRVNGNTSGERYFDEFKNQPSQDLSLLDKAKGFLNSIDEAYEEGRAARKAQWEKTKANVWNTLSDYAANAGKAIENYGNEITAAGERAMEAYNNGESINMEDPTQGFEGENYNRAKMNVYNELVGKPAGYAAITPGMPGIVRMAGGALAAPTLVDSTMQTYDQNIANDDGTPVISTAKGALLDPVINPIKEAITNPGEYVQSLVDNPLEAWDKVFLPGAIIHGAAKGIKKATPKSISEPIREHITEPFNEHVIDPVKSGLANAKGRFFDSFKRGGETGFDDLARDTEMGTQAFRETNLPPEYGETGDIKTDVYNRLRQNGFTDSEAAGITGNIAQESMFDTEALSKDGYNSHGLVQWTGDRKAHLEQFARENGLDPKDWRTQVDFISEEMNTTERAAFEALRKNPNITPEEAARIVREQYERPDPAVANDAYRQQVAREVYDGRNVRPMQRPIQNSFNDFAEDVKQATPEEANLNFMKDPVKDITPEELSNRIKDGTIPKEVFRTYDEAGYNAFKDLPEKQKFEYARQETLKLADGIDDPMGEKVRVIFDKENKNAVDDAVKAFTSGHGENMSISDSRAFATGLIKDTVQNPDFILKQKNGRKLYVNLWRGKDNLLHQIAVSMDKTDKGKIISSSTAMDKPRHRNNAINQLSRDIKNADELIYVGENIRGRQSGYPLQPSSDRGSTPDTQLHPSGNSIVAEETGKVKLPDDERSFMARPVEEAAGNDLTTWQGETISRKQILDDVNSIFGATIKKGRVGKKGTNGWYNPKTDIIRTRTFGDPRTVMHELGHYVDARFKFSNRLGFDTEFSNVIRKRFGNAYDKGGIETIRKEGIAEFFHDYVTSRKKAASEFPTFYKEFKKILEGDKDLRAAVDKLSYVGHQWYAQPVWEQIKGGISFSDSMGRKSLAHALRDGKLGEAGKAFYHNMYTKLVDELHPYDELTKEGERRIGRKFSTEESPYEQAWLARGWAGKAKALIERGVPEKGIIAFKDIVRKIPDKLLKDFSTYLTALRELDMNRWNKSLPEGETKLITRYTEAECLETIKHYEKSSVFKKAAAEIHKYTDYLLSEEAVNAGMLSKETAAAMKNKYPHYVPFFREFYEAADTPGKGTGKGFVNVGGVTKKMKGSTLDVIDPIESIARSTYAIINAVERNKVGQSIVRLSKIDGMGSLVEKVDGAAKVTDHSFSVWENGKKVVYNTTPELYQAFKMLNPEGANMVVKILSIPAKWLRAGAVLSPEFMLRNPARDMTSAAVYSKHGFIPVADTLKGLALYLHKGDTYWEYMRSGAAQANLVSLDRNYLAGQMRDLLQRPSVKKMVTTNPIEILRGLSEATEMATRLAEFHNVRKGYTGIGNRLFGKTRKPGSIQEAALESRDITLDFSRIGSHTKSWNKISAFFNASIQGTDKMFRAWRENPLDMTIKTAMFITMPSVLLWYLNKDDPRYQELPQWQKDIFWIIPAKDTLIKIPKPFELGILFGTVPERMLQWMYDRKRKQKGVGFKGLAGSVLDSMAPSFLPTALVPAIEAMTNHSIFMGRDIVPQSQQNTIPKLQYGPYTSAVGREIGETFGISPRIVDNTIRGYTGGLGGFGLTLSDSVLGLDETRPAKRFSEQPGIRGFTATPYSSSESVQEVYDAYDRQLKLFNAGRELHRRMDGFDPREFEQMKNAVKAFQNINQARKAVMKSSLSSEAKRKRLDEIQMSQVRIARKALGKGDIK